MKIGFDLLPLKTYNFLRGIGKYSYDLVKTILTIDYNNEYYLFNVPNDIFKDFIRENVTLYERAACLDEIKDIDIFIYTSLFELDSEIIPNPLNVNCKKAVILYDLIPILFWENYIPIFTDTQKKRYFSRLASINEFDIIFTISNSTKHDLIELLGIPQDKIILIYSGLNSNYLAEKSSSIKIREIKLKYGIKRSYLLSTPGFDFRKNISGIFQAFSLLSSCLKDNFDLVLVCKLEPIQKQILYNIWKELKNSPDHLILTGYIPVDDLITLYDGAELFIFPSLYEGFGIPILEAMSRGCPVITSNVSSLPEVCESAGILINPYDSQQISCVIEELINNNYLRRKLISIGYEQYQKFSWIKVAQRVLSVIEAMFQKSPENLLTNINNHYRIAFFTPLNPIKSGISDYSELLLTVLRSRYDIDIYIDSSYTPDNPNITNNFNILSHTMFESNKQKYDLCVYQMGNSKYHSYMFDYILKYPGMTVLHDLILPFFIESICINKEQQVFDTEKFLNYVFINHGYYKYLQVSKRLNDRLPFDHYDFSLNFLKSVIDSSIKTIVHNEYSKRFVESNISFSNVSLIRMGFPESQYQTNEKNNIKNNLNINNQIIISAFGRITKTKRIDVLLLVLAKIVNEYNIKNILLILVGSVYSDMKREIDYIIQREQLQDYIKITGFISNDDFNKYYSITDICINLRYPTSGETSATLINAFKFGLPVITSNISQYKEYPENCVWKVDVDDNEIEILTEYLVELIKNKNLREKMSENSLKYYKDRHSQNKMLCDYIYNINCTINLIQQHNRHMK